jgi:hypothetical protein
MVVWCRHVDIETGKDVRNYSTPNHASPNATVRACGCLERHRWEEMVYTRYKEILRTVSLYRPLTHTELKALATSRKTMPVSLFLTHFSSTKPHSISSKLDHSKTIIQMSKDYKKISSLYKKLITHILHI